MLMAMIVLGVLMFVAACLLLFLPDLLRKWSLPLNRVLIPEDWFYQHHLSLGILLLGITFFLFGGAYFVAKFVF